MPARIRGGVATIDHGRIVARDTPCNLKGEHTSTTTRIRMSTADLLKSGVAFDIRGFVVRPVDGAFVTLAIGTVFKRGGHRQVSPGPVRASISGARRKGDRGPPG